jgi:hypothetical protein
VTVDPSFRCSAAGLERADSIAGSASTVRAFLLIENPGPWGVDAVRDSRLPAPVKAGIRVAAARAKVRPLLIRRYHRRAPRTGFRVYAAWAGLDDSWLQTAVLDGPDDLLDLDLEALGAGRSPGLVPTEETLVLVCTHGKHDACCAEKGRPVAAALAAAYPEETWEVSHIGGDRFAGNLLVLPHGLYYGRIDPTSAIAVAGAHLTGHVDLDHLRGRSGWAMPVQAAEIALRRRLGETALDAVRLERRGRDGTTTRVEMTAAGRRWAVTVVSTTGPATAQLTCRAARENPLPRHEVREILALS